LLSKAASLRRWQACDHHPFGAPMHPLGG
jgi:hypothetical protein